ncbi:MULTISPECIES: YggT family protein [Tsukamurella]|uniref:YggT family protein n=1 Tax=Tsukamurella strandjordii TaxID=147577 RepID=A0AA90NRJ1_9ACTN|nr:MULTISPECIES: YggT family protein [Tsukamurella]MDP0399469.1 YggT family protein [Tsukamurella strandjordii]GIZ95644.1 membrane protein [Tsukamurella sp. TY48]
MQAIWLTLYALLGVYTFLLIVRLVIEVVKSFARDWNPTGIVAVLLEAIFSVTDPPLKLLRKFIPPLKLGQIQLDLSYLVLFILLAVLRYLIQLAAASSS